MNNNYLILDDMMDSINKLIKDDCSKLEYYGKKSGIIDTPKGKIYHCSVKMTVNKDTIMIPFEEE